MILEAALRLSEKERLELAEELYDSLPDSVGLLSLDDPNLLSELDRRANDGSAGIPWEQLRDEL
jgi:putative addiction module component (TIGR02574 family)